jgi:hypothetical protein
VRERDVRARQAAARKATAEAKAKGAVGRGGSLNQRVLRNSAIVASAWAGVPQKRIAQEFGITDRMVRMVLADYEAQPSGLDHRPMEIVEDLSRLYRSTYRDFFALAARYEESNPTAAVGARRQARDTLADWITLLAAIGKLPTDLEVLATQADLLRLGDLILQYVDAVEQGERTPAELAEFVHGVILSRGVPPAIERRASSS